MLNRLQCEIGHKLFPQQAGFRPGTFGCSQVLNLTQHIADGLELDQITGAAPPKAAYGIINQRRLLAKLVERTDDVPLSKFIKYVPSKPGIDDRFYL